jgi:glucan 1,3-beta-glucosidase
MTIPSNDSIGYGVGARYDGSYPGSTYHSSCTGVSNLSTWTNEMRISTGKYIEAQMETFEANGQGWIFWNFKTEDAGEWDLFALLDANIFPNPVTSRNFPPACN